LSPAQFLRPPFDARLAQRILDERAQRFALPARQRLGVAHKVGRNTNAVIRPRD
jgi:hypothetical protein